MKRVIPILLLFLFIGSVKCLAVEDTLIHLVPGKQQGVYIKNSTKNIFWAFRNDDSPEYARPGYNDTGWMRINPELKAEELKDLQLVNRPSWFRVRVRADHRTQGKIVALMLEGDGKAYVYWDGVLLDSIVSDTKDHQDALFKNHPIFYKVEDTCTHLLAVRYYQTFYHVIGEKVSQSWGFEFDIEEASNTVMNIRFGILTQTFIVFSFACLFATLFLVHLVLFLFYRSDLSNLYFSFFNIGFATFLFALYDTTVGLEVINDYIFERFLISSIILACFSFSAFSSYLFSRKKIFFRVIAIYTAILIIVSFVASREAVDSDLFGVAVLFLFFTSLVYSVILFTKAIIRKEPGSRILGVGLIFSLSFFIGVILYSILADGVSITISNNSGWLDYLLVTLAIMAVLSMPLSITAFLAWRFSTTSKNLLKQLKTVENLSQEKQSILENQNAHLENEVAIRTRQIAEEKKRSDDLLLNILPNEVAEELKLHGHSKAHRYDQVSVLFTDFVNFTKVSEQLGVEELLNELNINFTAFDRIMEKHGLEKIKTIGDAYLAVCGVPVVNTSHARNTINAALEILDFVEERKSQSPYGLDIRIGINSGSLIAGIIGVKKFAYDIWGDTVNTAARMEQNSEPGKINISESTCNLVKEEFICLHRGKIDAKGKGEIDMYFVERRR